MSDSIYFEDIYQPLRIEIVNRFEICQGGPNVGTLMIDGDIRYPQKLFGGPMLIIDDAIYMTLRYKGFFVNGFKLISISLKDFSMKEYNLKKDVINIQGYKDGVIYYSTRAYDSPDKNMKMYRLL